MDFLVLGQDDVERLLPMRECVEVIAEALRSLARNRAVLPLRRAMRLPGDSGNVLTMMPAALGDAGVFGAKVISVFPGNGGTPYDTHQGAVLVFEAEHGRLLAAVDAASVTAIRTAAASAVATGVLARKDARTLAILGAGTQARSHLEAMLVTRDIRGARVWSQPFDHARRFASRESERHGIEIAAFRSVGEAVAGADIICTTTAASDPVLEGAWITSGAHVNAVGSSIARARELDTAAVVRARLFVDRRESALNEAGDFLTPKAEGAVTDDHILAEIGEVLIGSHPGRTAADEITVFKSLGIGVEDVAAAYHVYTRAAAEGAGTRVDFGGRRHE